MLAAGAQPARSTPQGLNRSQADTQCSPAPGTWELAVRAPPARAVRRRRTEVIAAEFRPHQPGRTMAAPTLADLPAVLAGALQHTDNAARKKCEDALKARCCLNKPRLPARPCRLPLLSGDNAQICLLPPLGAADPHKGRRVRPSSPLSSPGLSSRKCAPPLAARLPASRTARRIASSS